MAITRINNNQITDSVAGNLFLGVNAAVKVQDFTITAGKIANNLTYNSDLTITGNLTVQGNTTAIDTINLVVEDPLILLAKEQTGAPALDIGFIGKRGTEDNIAFVWDESADQFVAVFTTSEVTNSIININSYASLQVLDLTAANANITGNLTFNGSVIGNVDVTGNITGGNLISDAAIDGVTITASGNLVGGNANVTGDVNSATVTASGNVSGGNLVTLGNVDAANVNASAGITAGTTIVATGNVSGGNITTAGNVDGANVNASAGITAGTTIVATGNVSGGNITTAGNVDGANVNASAGITAGTTVVATGNVSGGNITTAGNVDGANVNATTAVTAVTVTASGNVNGGNINSNSIVGTDIVITATSVDMNLTGNLSMSGRFINDLGTPSIATDAATKQYVDDAVSAGIHIHTPVDVETAGALPSVTYANGGNTFTVNETIAGNTVVFTTAANLQVNDQLWFDNSFNGVVGNLAYFVVSTPNTSAAVLSTAYNGVPVSNITSGSGLTESVRVNSGVGATLTATANGALTVDGYAVSAGNRVLVDNQVNQIQNGVYVVTDAGNVTAPFILTRSSDADKYIPDDSNGLDQGSYFYVEFGDTGAGASYVKTAPAGPFIFGVANIEFTQFSSSQVYSANTAAGLVLNGTVFSAKVDNETTAFISGNIAVKTNANLITPNIGNATGNSLTLGGNGLLSATTVTATGNVSGGNLTTAGNIDGANVNATAGITAGTTLIATGNVSGGNITTAGNIDGANVNATAGITAGTTIVATGNVSGGNITTAGNIDGANVNATAGITAGTTIVATGNVTGGNLITTGTADLGNIRITGNDVTNFASNVITINAAASDIDVRISGDTVANLLVTDAGTDTVVIGSANATTGAALKVDTTDSMMVPVGNTVQRPGSPEIGMFRFNTGGDALEVYTSGGWEDVGVPAFTVIVADAFVGDGSTVAFTLSANSTTAGTIVSINGIVQEPTTAYSVSSTTLTFTEAPAVSDNIDARILTTTTTVTSIENISGNAVVEVLDSADTVQITGNVIPVTSNIYNLGSTSLRWNELFLQGSTITLGNVVIKNTAGNTIGFFGPDGTTPGAIDTNNIDSAGISNGTSSMQVIASGGNIRANVGGAAIAVFHAGGIDNGQANGVGNIGTATSYFNTIFAQATSAQYADLAEMYEADAVYEPGTVLCFGGAKEVTVCGQADSTRVAGVVSTNPSYLMNSGQTGDNVVAVALTGRVPCKVTGTIRKGDLIVAAGAGRARANNAAAVGTVIGKALADFDGADGVIEVVVGRV